MRDLWGRNKQIPLLVILTQGKKPELDGLARALRQRQNSEMFSIEHEKFPCDMFKANNRRKGVQQIKYLTIGRTGLNSKQPLAVCTKILVGTF